MVRTAFPAAVIAALAWIPLPGSAAPTPAEPATNPFLAAEYNNQSHWNDAATDSTEIAVPRGHYRVTPGSYDWIPSEALGIPAYSAMMAGREVHWFFAGSSLRKFVRGGEWLQEVDRRSIRQGLREGPWPSDALRAEQLEALRERIAARDEQAVIDYLLAQPNRLVSAVEDQVAQGVLYSLLTAD